MPHSKWGVGGFSYGRRRCRRSRKRGLLCKAFISLITNHCSAYKNRSRGTIQCYYLFIIFALNRKRWLAISHGQLGKEHGQSHEKHKYGRCYCDGRSDYNWIALPMYAHTKLIPRRTRRAMTIPRPPFESSRQKESRSAVPIFV